MVEIDSNTRVYQVGEFSCTIRFVTMEEALQKPSTRLSLYISDLSIASHVPSLSAKELGDALVLFPPGESAKAWNSVEIALQRGFALGLTRHDTIVGLGGGVITDLSAFVASLYMRGTKLILVPTTLLAMVDAAFGGKSGINFDGYKNMVGTFYPAMELRVCPDFLNTLSPREYLSGLAEVIKSAMLDDQELWNLLKVEQKRVLVREPSITRTLVERSLLVKARVVEEDFRETGIRAHLNLGHTFAHALESVAGLGQWTHGEAVAWGLVKAIALSVHLGLARSEYLQEVKELIESYGFRTSCSFDPKALVKAMYQDKKKVDGSLRFVLQTKLCETQIVQVAESQVLAVL